MIPQSLRTQLVAAPLILLAFEDSHWQAKSDAPQSVLEATADAMHGRAHAGSDGTGATKLGVPATTSGAEILSNNCIS